MNDYFAKLAQIESGGNPLAKNPASSAKGMFQFIDNTAQQYGINAPFGTPEYAQQEIDAVQKFTADNKAALASALGREPTQGELYLAHQQGAGGAKKLLTNPNARASDLVGADAINLNAGNPEMTAQEFASQWTSKFDDGSTTAEGKQETFNVKLPDGTMLENIPIGTPKEQIKAKLAAGGYDVTQLEPQEQVAEAEAEPEKRQAGFLQRVGEAYSDRLGNVGEGVQASANDEQTWAEAGAQGLGQGVGFVGDVLGNTLVSGYRYLPDVEYGLGEAASAIGSIPAGGDETVASRLGQGMNYLGEKGREFSQEYPRLARNLGAAGNVGAAVLPIKGLNVAGKVGKTAGQATRITGEVLDQLIPKADNITSETLKTQAGQFYKVADELGGVLPPESTVKLFDNITGAIGDKTADLSEATRKALTKVADKEGVTSDALQVFETLKGEPLTLKGFQTIDQSLGDAAYARGTSDEVSRNLLIMQRKLRDTVENIKPADLVGGSEGFEAYKRGRDIWSKAARVRDLENITAKAFATDQPANSLKRALKRFVADKDNLRGFNATEIEAINKAADSGVISNMIRGMAGRLPTSVAIAANPAIAPALSVASTGARSLADDVMLKKVQDINNLIATGQANKFSLPAYATQGLANTLGTGGSLIEKAYSGGRGNLATLGTLQQLERERQREQQRIQ